MLSSRLISGVSQWLRLLSARLPGGAVLIISQPARLNPSPGAFSSKWMRSPWMVFSLHSETLQQRKRSEQPWRQVHACTDTHTLTQTGILPECLPPPHLFSFLVSPHTRTAVRGPQSNDHMGGGDTFRGGDGWTGKAERRVTPKIVVLSSPSRSANPASRGADLRLVTHACSSPSC